MSWRALPPLRLDAADRLPDVPGLRAVAGRVADHSAELFPQERCAVAVAAASRRCQFATGRHLAHLALRDLGIAPGAITRRDGRVPVWPAGIVGSISHAGDVAVAAVAQAAETTALGIDLELPGRVGPRIQARVLTTSERAHLDRADARLAGLMFSAKEAGFKAVNPLVGRYIAFHEAEVVVDWGAGRWRLDYLGSHADNRIMERGEGRFGFLGDNVVTVFVIPR